MKEVMLWVMLQSGAKRRCASINTKNYAEGQGLKEENKLRK
jgi:hypothetical protein